MPITMERLTAGHAEAAAALVGERLAELRRERPALSESCGAPQTLADRIARLADRGPGAAATDAGRLVGFLGAFPIRYAGRASMLSPEWAHGTAPGLAPALARRVLESLYAEAARAWDERGAETHIVCLLAHDRAALETCSWLGLGGIVCDAVRSLAPVAVPARWNVRQATAGDAETVHDFECGLYAHLSGSPAFLLRDEPEKVEWWRERIADPSVRVWVVDEGAGPLGYFIQGPANDSAADLIMDAGTSSIMGAFVAPQARSGGAAAALLSRAVEWAREQGYARLAVDFETANVEGRSFWLRHFDPVVLSLARTVRVRRESP